ncbi:MAG: hypothetical protein NVSMB17_07310 [Candidatus Dormibacteria bacterium]
MSQYARAVGATIPEQRFSEAVELAHAAARQYDALRELESAYFLADRENSRLLYVGLYATKADLDATAQGAREQFDAFSALTDATVDMWAEYEVVDETH